MATKIQVVEYDPDKETLQCVLALSHPEEVWCLAPSIKRPDRFISVYSKGGQFGSSLWEFDEEGSGLTEVCELKGHNRVIRSVICHPSDEGTTLTVDERSIRVWTLSESAARCVQTQEADELHSFWGAAWASGDPNTLGTCGGTGIQLWDLRSQAQVASVSSAHRMPVRDLNFSTQHAFHLVSAGDDCKVRIWDTRKLGPSSQQQMNEPVKDLGGKHSHWVWQARINPFHDELLLSSSSDCQVILWHVPLRPDATGSPSTPGTRQGPLLRDPPAAHCFDEHDDSVYSVAWSASDPWLFASLSYDGRVVVNRVPNPIKYKILL